MTEQERQLTDLGRLLEHAREELQFTGREAARRAGLSEGRWRQVVTGRQSKGDRLVPVNPRAITVVQMALAVGVQPAKALKAAGLAVSGGSVDHLVRNAEQVIAERHRDQLGASVSASDIEDLRQIRDDPARPLAFRNQASALLLQIEAMLQAAREEERARREAR